MDANTEANIREAARLFCCYEGWAAREHCVAKGISEGQIRTGARLARVQRDNQLATYESYGNPMYGQIHPSPKWLAQCAAREQDVIDSHLELTSEELAGEALEKAESVRRARELYKLTGCPF